MTFNQYVTLTPTLSNSVYSLNYSVGGLLSYNITGVTSGAPLYAENFKLYDKDNQNSNVEVIFFDSDPSSSGITDVASFHVDNNDMAKVISDIDFFHKDYKYLNGYALNLNKDKIILNGLTNNDTLYLTLVERSKAVGPHVPDTCRINGNLSIAFNIIG